MMSLIILFIYELEILVKEIINLTNNKTGMKKPVYV